MKETYGAAFVDYFQGRTPTKRAFTADEKEIYQEIQNATDRITELVAQQKSLPTRVPLAQAQPNQKARQAINGTKAPDQCPQAGCLPDRERLGEPYSSTLCQGRR